MAKKKRQKGLERPYEGYLFLLPWLIGFVGLTVVPMISSLVMSFTRYDIFSPMKYIGLDNYVKMFSGADRQFWPSLGITAGYVAMSVPIRLVTALLVALILNNKLKGINLYRTIYYLPSIVGGSVAMSVTWKMVLAKDGFINSFLALFGLGPMSFLASPDTALVTVSMLAVWQFGSSMVIFLAGLKQVPQELTEAAMVDGAGPIRRFFRITFPLITPTVFFNLIMTVIGAFQVFTAAYIMTQGGPAGATYFYMLHLYKQAFEGFNMGYASALAWVLAIIIIVLTAISFKLSDKWVYYDA